MEIPRIPEIIHSNSEGGTYKLNKYDYIGMLLSFFTVFTVLIIVESKDFMGTPIIIGDSSLFNVNSSAQFMLSQQSPWLIALTLIFYKINPDIFGLFYNGFNIIPMLMMPITMYILLTKLQFSIPSKILGSILYVINPMILLWGGWEYAGPLMFLPLIIIPMISYSDDRKFIHLINSGIFLFLFMDILGVSQIKLIWPVVAFILLYLILYSARQNLLKTLVHTLFFILFTFVISLPIIIITYGQFNVYSNNFHQASSNIYNIEIGIVKYVYSASNLQNSIMGLNAYPGSPLQTSGYISSFQIAGWFLIVILGLAASLLYEGKYKLLYKILFTLDVILVIFQFGVYNGTFLFLFRYDFAFIYNYPLFVNMMQVFIYSLFFSILIDKLYRGEINVIQNKRLFWLNTKNKARILAILAVLLILFSSMPIIEYSHAQSDKSQKYAMPAYWYEIWDVLSSYQDSRVLVLPNNGTTMTYLDGGVPYGNVYGLPYNYWSFASEFPNASTFSSIIQDFYNSNISKLAMMLESQNVGVVVVVNMKNNSPPTLLGNLNINGGGKYFAAEINQTGIFSILRTTRSSSEKRPGQCGRRGAPAG